ncbi:response regulator [Paraneptunicella aestuarii]|uniref:response regulator n=1 Tax=Paraneptunicella aestuarii TaxID=2831148 RepID=UPI001E3ACA2A|nr:response regulator [Paraneptunicella aestuarii]UAA37450.1 response regulator [Paraneptunicella aestuarii]
MDKQIASTSKVLVIDDQTLAKGYMKYSLEELGFEDIIYIERAQDALVKIRQTRFDLIICSYDLKKDLDGYFLYDELKANQEISPGTAFVFISADTSAELIHSIVELQPDDFLAKPFTVAEMDKRLTKLMARKRALKKIYRKMDKGDMPGALEEVEQFLTTPENSQYFPIALKTKGELFLACNKAQEAKDFYSAILNVQNFTWAQVGLVKALLLLDEDEEAEKRILRLAFKPDSQLLAYDLLTMLQIKKEDYETALESTVMATQVSPRNIRRHKQAVDLSRINNDYKTQFEEAKNIVKFAKNSIHDKPEIYLNVARAGIDYALTTDEDESFKLAQQASDFLRQFEASGNKQEIEEQLAVANARLMYLQNDKENALKMMEQFSNNNWENADMEDLLDKAKAFHELGLHPQSQAIMDEIEKRCMSGDDQSQLFLKYVKKEKQQRIDIKDSPRDLNNHAVEFYERGDLESALKSFRQAFTVMPKNPSIALNLLQTMAMRAREKGLPKGAKEVINSCIKTIEEGQLNEEQQLRYEKIRGFLDSLG